MNTRKYRETKNIVVEQILQDLKKNKRAIVRGLGTFKVVKYKAKKNNFGDIPARKNIKFRADPRIRKEL